MKLLNLATYMTINTDPQKVEELLARGVNEVINYENLKKQLLSGKKLRVKLGIDPTSPDLHLGRSVPLLKLRDFQQLGHHIIFLVGNATGLVGDTSDKDAERPMLKQDAVDENMQKYVEQAGKIIDIDRAEIAFNADWLNKLGYKEIGEHADAFSLASFIQRENIKKRLNAGKRISLRELLYPLMQGYDSVALKADIEIGGTDQRFNLLAGRTLQEQAGQKPQNVIMGNLIKGTDGRKMSSSWGNTIKITDEARDIGEKIMNIPDDLIAVYFENCTRVPQEEVNRIRTIEDKRIQKIALAGAIIGFYYDQKSAKEQENYLREKFIAKTKNVLTEAYKCKVEESLVDIMVDLGVAKSKSEAKRKIQQGGVSIDTSKMNDIQYTVHETDNQKILKVGKKFFTKLEITK